MAKFVFDPGEYVDPGERLELTVKGSGGKWLVITDKHVYIFRLSFLNRRVLENGKFQMPYAKINSVQLEYHTFEGGEFTVSADGVVDQTVSVLAGQTRKVDPNAAPNRIRFMFKKVLPQFEEAQKLVNRHIAECRVDQPPVPTSSADEIAKFKQLLDAGAITPDEYEAKKKQLLDL